MGIQLFLNKFYGLCGRTKVIGQAQFGCGGIADTLHYVHTAATFGLGVALHSGTELGVGQITPSLTG